MSVLLSSVMPVPGIRIGLCVNPPVRKTASPPAQAMAKAIAMKTVIRVASGLVII